LAAVPEGLRAFLSEFYLHMWQSARTDPGYLLHKPSSHQSRRTITLRASLATGFRLQRQNFFPVKIDDTARTDDFSDSVTKIVIKETTGFFDTLSEPGKNLPNGTQ